MQINGLLNSIQEIQRGFHDRIASDINLLHSGDAPFAAAAGIIFASFLYGVFHAVGPGHGKVIVTGYLLADDSTVRRGITLTCLSALLQALVAIGIVIVLFYGLGMARAQAEFVGAWLEIASYVFVALIGAALLLRGVRDFASRGHAHDENCGHAHGQGCGHAHGQGCGHAHGVDARMVASAPHWRTMMGLVLSIGIRPCSGALIVMVFSCLLGEVMAGIAATFAMAAGTAITTSAVAALAAYSRTGLLALAGKSEKRIVTVSACCKMAGGLFILALGMLFFFSSLSAGIGSGASPSPANHPLIRAQ